MTRNQITRSIDRALSAGYSLRTISHVAKLAAFVRSHGFPCRVQLARKSGKLYLRAAMSIGYDTTKIREAQRRNWSLERIEPNMPAVKQWLGY